MIGPPGINLISNVPNGLLAGPALLSRNAAVVLNGIFTAKRGSGLGEGQTTSIAHGHVLDLLAATGLGASGAASIRASASLDALLGEGAGDGLSTTIAHSHTLSPSRGLATSTGYQVTAVADAFLTLLGASGAGSGFTASIAHGHAFPILAAEGSGGSETQTLTTTDDLPLYVDQLLLTGDAYYTDDEWPDHSHLLKDHRTGVGDLRDRRSGRAVYIHSTSVQASGADIGDGDVVTVAFRAKKTDETTNFVVSRIGGTDQWTIGLTGTTAIQAVQHGASGVYRNTQLKNLDLTTWTNVVIVMTADTSWIWADGEEVSDSSVASPWNTSGGTFTVGAREARSDAALCNIKDLVIAEADLWDERETLLDDPSNALAHYPFEEETGVIAYNRLANENHLTWNNPTESLLHVTEEVSKSWADSEGFTHGAHFDSDATGTSYSNEKTWISRNTVTGDFRVDFQLNHSLGAGVIFGLQDSATTTESNNYNQLNFGFQWRDDTSIRAWQDGSSTIETYSMSVGDTISIRRSGTTTALYIEDSLVHTYSGTSEDAMYASTTHATSTKHVTLSYFNGQQITDGHLGSTIIKTDLIIPARTSTLDALGNTLTYAGEAPSPGLYHPPVLVGNGTDVTVSIPEITIASADGFDITFKFKRNTDAAPGSPQFLFDCETGRLILAISSFLDTSYEIGVYDGTDWHSFGTAPLDEEWHSIRFVGDGVDTVEVFLDGESLGTDTYTLVAIGGNSSLLGNWVPSSSYADVQLAYADIKKYDGTPVRYYVPDGGTAGMHDLVSGETGTIEGTATYSQGDGSWQDPRIRYGGRFADENLIPHSNDFSSWTAISFGTGSTPIVTSEYSDGPLGTPGDATRLQASLGASNTTSDYSLIRVQGYNNSARDTTTRCWMKSNTGASQDISFYLAGGGSTYNIGAHTVSDSWVEYTFDSSEPANLYIGSRGNTYGGDESIDILVAYAQVNNRDSAGYYQETGADYIDAKRLIPSRGRGVIEDENLIPFSNDFDSWSTLNSGTGSSSVVTAAYAAGPDGIASKASRLESDRGANNTASDYSLIRVSGYNVPTRLTTLSCWLKSNTGVSQNVTFWVGSASGSFHTSAHTITTEWQEVTFDAEEPVTTNIGTRGGSFGGDESIDILVAYAQVYNRDSEGHYQETGEDYIDAKNNPGYADGNDLDPDAASHVFPNKFADPQAVIDRTGGITNSVFAVQSQAPVEETVSDDTKTDTSSRCRKRTTNSYVDRIGSKEEPMTTSGSDTYFGD